MADKHVNSISLKALVDKGNQRVIYAESDEDFIDVLFSFLTMPMGTIIRLTRNQSPGVDIGCMNNLYKSVENFDVERLQTEACKAMLLCPRSAAETHCRSLTLEFDDGEPTRYFLCSSRDCTASKYMLLSHHMGALCGCGRTMSREINLSNKVSKKLISAIQDRGVFVKGLTRLIITDDLQVGPPSTEKILSILSKLGVMEYGSTIEERTFDVGVNKVLNLLKCSLVSKIALTETLLEQKPLPQLPKKEIKKGRVSIHSSFEGKIWIKIMVSKSKKVVCYAEAGEDFINLLFSFLTLPLGYIVKELQGSPTKGCVDNLYTSVQELDAEHYMKSDKHQAMLINPKVAPGFRYENQLLGIEQASHPPYYLGQCLLLNSGLVEDKLTTDETQICPSGNSGTVLTVMDPKCHNKEAKKCGGFVKGPAKFTVTDNLIITPVSPVLGISRLNKMKLPLNDVVEHSVSVGDEEALWLLEASFVSDSPLTDTFIRSRRSARARGV